MANISTTDRLFISAVSMGQQFYNFAGSGIDSLSEIIELVRNYPATPRGMVTLTVRNASQGWAENKAFYNY